MATCLLVVLYQFKKDSADGRLLMWKIAGRAILDNPVRGTGSGGFPAAFAKAQADYFSSGQGTEKEKLVAGSPEYAFNEYLQIGMEQGVGGWGVFILGLISICMYCT